MSLPAPRDLDRRFDLGPTLRPVLDALRTLQRAAGSSETLADLNRKRLLLEELSDTDAVSFHFDLRRIHEILEDLLDTCQGPDLLDHAERWRCFEPVRVEERELLAALERLERLVERERGRDWGVLERRLAELTRLHAPPLQELVGPQVESILEEWLAGSTSLQRLRERLAPLVAPLHEIVWQTARDQLQREVAQPASLALFLGELHPALEAADLAAASLASQAARETPLTSPPFEPPALIELEDVPLRPGRARFAELLRGRSAQRRRLFGPPECPTELLSPTEKVRWLAGSAQSALAAVVLSRLGAFAAETVARASSLLVASFAPSFQRAVACKLEARRRRVGSELDRFEGILAAGDDLGEHVVALEEALRGALRRLRPLLESPAELAPAPRPLPAPAPPPQRSSAPPAAASERRVDWTAWRRTRDV